MQTVKHSGKTKQGLWSLLSVPAMGLHRKMPRRYVESMGPKAFCFSPSERALTKLTGLHGLHSKNTAHRHTPVQKANSVDCATVKAFGNSGVKLGQAYKRSNPSCALGQYRVNFVFPGVDGAEWFGEWPHIHPRHN